MNDHRSRRLVRLNFSLSNLLTLTAFIAIGTAVGLAYQRNRSMIQQRAELLSVSSRLQIDNPEDLASSAIPKMANDFESWHVYVPEGQEYELRLGVGAVSENGIPPTAGGVRIPAGRHRVTLHAGDSPDEQFGYVVYLDGEQVIEKTMGSDWMPRGWSTSSSTSWPREPRLSPAPLQLAARRYKAKMDFGDGRGHYFNGQSDNYVTQLGYRLWIDVSNRTYQPASPFIGIANDRGNGIGLRDGLRYRSTKRPPYEWQFTRPKLDTNDSVMRIAAEFFASEGTVLSSQTKSFQAWQLHNDALGKTPFLWQADPAQSACSAFLHAKLESGDAPQPVVEMRWEVDRPDEVGLRLADTPQNDQVSGWRLRFLGGTSHLWRELQIGGRRIQADEVLADVAKAPPGNMVRLDIEDNATADTRLQWQTDQSLPLQILERKQNVYAGMGLYQGLPVTFGIQVPAALKPTVATKVVKKDPDAPGEDFPGGVVFDEIHLDLEAAPHEWIWLRVSETE